MTHNIENLILSYQKQITCHECHEDTNHELSILSCFEDGNDFTDGDDKSGNYYEFKMSESWWENEPLIKFVEKIDGLDKFTYEQLFFKFNFIFTAILLPLLLPLYIVKSLIEFLMSFLAYVLHFATWVFVFFIEVSIETILFFLNPKNWYRALRGIFLFPLRLIKSPGKTIYLKKTECLICNFQFQKEILQKDITSYQLEYSDSLVKKYEKDFKAQQKKIEAKIKKDLAWLNKFNKK